MRALTALTSGLLGLALLGCCCFGGAATLCADACRTSGECRLRTERAGDGPYRCYAGSDEDCRGSDTCTRSGRCFATEDGQCVPEGDIAAHACAISPTCRVWGGCHPREGFCEPQSEADCVASLQCRTQGRCGFDAERNFCYPRPADCAGTTGCEIEGLCTYETSPFGLLGGFGACALTPAGSCESTVACRRDGRCAARPLEGCSEGCRVFYCGRPESLTAPSPCVETQGTAHLVCEPDGRCIRGASGACEHLP